MKTSRIAEFGMLLALALVLSYLESLIPVVIAVPGVKLGLANIMTILILYRMNGRFAFFFMTARVLLTGFLFAGISTILYSFVGGLFCILVMSVLKKSSFFSVLGVSMAGAVFHNVGQILVAILIMENAHILYYLLVLCVTGMASGLAIGYLAHLLMKQYNKIYERNR
ncbi:MAG: Gx transporter family protein [Lachnospiraceae bacterium]|nr:Gx transporter family protein [Lachnospiraceae bacterium]